LVSLHTFLESTYTTAFLKGKIIVLF